MPYIKINVDSNARDYADWISRVPERIQLKIEAEIPTLKRKTKKTVKNELTTNFGVDEGIYRKSFIINDYSRNKWEVAFQVFARKPHYRLTHLLEGEILPNCGHATILFRRGIGRPTTRKGLRGMSHIFATKTHYKGHTHPPGYTGIVKHIEPGQKYAEQELPILYDEGINKILTERMRRLK